MYKRYIKRWLDFVLALIAIVILSPVFAVVSLLVRVKIGKPVFFSQERATIHKKKFYIKNSGRWLTREFRGELFTG